MAGQTARFDRNQTLRAAKRQDHRHWGAKAGVFTQGDDAMEGTAGLPKSLKDERCWREFTPGHWRNTIDVRDFIVTNATPYEGDEKFLVGPSKRTKAVWEKLQPYFTEERKKGVLAV